MAEDNKQVTTQTADEKAAAEKAAADAAAAAAAEAETTEETETTETEFDPSTIDPNDTDALASLTEEQLDAVTEFQASQKKEAQEKEAADNAPESEEEEDTAGTATGASAAAGDQQVKYADKYATPDELIKGVEALLGKLGYDNDFLRAQISTAKESKQYGAVEQMYKALEVEFGKRSSQPASAAPDAAPTQDTQQADTVSTEDKDFVNKISAVAFSRLQGSQLERDLKDEGLSLPTTSEEFKALREGAPYFAMKFEMDFKAAYDEVAKEAIEHSTVLKGRDTHNLGIVNSDVQAIKDFAAANDLKLSDAEIEQVKASALASPLSYETKAGVKLLRPEAVKDYFNARILPSKIKEMQTAALSKGRLEASEDLDKLHKKAVRSIGTSPLNTRTRTKTAKVNVDNPDEVAALSDEQLENFK